MRTPADLWCRLRVAIAARERDDRGDVPAWAVITGALVAVALTAAVIVTNFVNTQLGPLGG